MQISSEQIRDKMNAWVTYGMSLRGSTAKVVANVVNVGIDSHLEACFVPSRGDSYQWTDGRLECEVSAESLPVLIRRLMEIESTGRDGDDADVACGLATDILTTLGFDVETACFKLV